MRHLTHLEAHMGTWQSGVGLAPFVSVLALAYPSSEVFKFVLSNGTSFLFSS